jgi:hypothetical protein
MDRFGNSMALAKASWGVLRDDKKLTLLPLFSGLATLLVVASFLVPAAALAHNSAGGGYQFGPVTWILGAIGYVLAAYVVIFFNAALMYAADAKLHGVTVSLGDAVRFAASRSHVLLPWAVVSATVSIVLRGVEQRGGIIGRIVGMIAGVAWSLVTFLVMPVLVVEGMGPIAAVKRSGELFKRTWGEQVMSNFGIGLVALGAILVGAIPAMLLVAIGGPVAVLGIVAFVVWVVIVSLVSSALTGILCMALYRYATEGTVPGWDNTQLHGAFRPRRSSRGGFAG